MPCIYDAAKRAQDLTIKFQKNKEIPLSVLTGLFANLTKMIASLFAVYENKDDKIEAALNNLLIAEEEFKESDKAFRELSFLDGLLKGNVTVFKNCAGNSPMGISDAEKYAEVFKRIVYVHVFQLISELIINNRPKHSSQMWSKVSSEEKMQEGDALKNTSLKETGKKAASFLMPTK